MDCGLGCLVKAIGSYYSSSQQPILSLRRCWGQSKSHHYQFIHVTTGNKSTKLPHNCISKYAPRLTKPLEHKHALHSLYSTNALRRRKNRLSTTNLTMTKHKKCRMWKRLRVQGYMDNWKNTQVFQSQASYLSNN
jgi:hypothetical protein